jgi:hypothetical protein
MIFQSSPGVVGSIRLGAAWAGEGEKALSRTRWTRMSQPASGARARRAALLRGSDENMLGKRNLLG